MSTGDTKSSKISLIRNGRETDQDFSKASNKLNTIGVHCTDRDWKSNDCGAALKVDKSSSGLQKGGEDWHRYDEQRDLEASVKNSEYRTHIASNVAPIHIGNLMDRDLLKKKENDNHDTELYMSSIASGGHPLAARFDFIEENSEIDHHKEKKAKVSKSRENEVSTSQGRGGSSMYNKSVKDQKQLPDIGKNLSRRSLDAVDSVKRHIGSIEPTVIATSVSYKVSGSHRSNLQEMEGSPVESVSSSPLRDFGQEKPKSTRRNLGSESDSRDFLSARTSPSKCFDGDDAGANNEIRIVEKDVTNAVNYGYLESFVADFQEIDLVHISNMKAETEHVGSLEFTTCLVGDTLLANQYPCKPRVLDQDHNSASMKGSQCHGNGSRRKSGNVSSRPKDKTWHARSESDRGKSKPSNCNKSVGHSPYREKLKGRIKSREKIGLCPEKVGNSVNFNKGPAGNLVMGTGVKECSSNFSLLVPDKQVVISRKDLKQHRPLELGDDRSSLRFPFDKTNEIDVTGKGKSQSLPSPRRGQNETACPRQISRSHKENGASISLGVATEGDNDTEGYKATERDNVLKAPKQINKSENQNGSQPINSRHTTKGDKIRDVDGPSPVRRDLISQAASSAIKEAKDLKHLADRLKVLKLSLFLK